MTRLKTIKPRLQTMSTQRVKTAEIKRERTAPREDVTPRTRGRAWMEIRARWLRANPLCCVCEAEGKITIADEVDHIVPLSVGGRDHESNYQSLCKPCHAVKTAGEAARRSTNVQHHPEWLPEPTIPVYVIAGPPGSGKTTYVRERAQPGDLVLDADFIAADLHGLPLYHATRDQLRTAIRYRNQMLGTLASARCPYRCAWLIVTAGSPDKREFWRRKYGNLQVLDTDKATCMERVRSDTRRRPEDIPAILAAISEWF
jgi:5-methylcytosine-specific restriction protein A